MKIKGIYVIEFENGIKFGISNDIQARMLDYYSPWQKKINQSTFFTCRSPRLIENELRKYFKKNTRKGSYEFIYGIPFEDVVSVVIAGILVIDKKENWNGKKCLT